MVLPLVLLRAAKHASVQRVWHVCDSMFGLASVIVVPLLFAIYGFWHFERPAFHNLNQATHTVIEVPAGTSTRVSNPLTVSPDLKSIVYHMWLADTSDTVVYVYPDVKVESPSRLTFGDQTVKIPASLKPGTYTLNVDLEYPLNPVKTASVRMELARVRVTR